MLATITVLPDADDVATYTVENFTNVYFYSQYVEVALCRLFLFLMIILYLLKLKSRREQR